MDRVLSCAAGHRWNTTASSLSKVGPGLCPYCGKPAVAAKSAQPARPQASRTATPAAPAAPPPLPKPSEPAILRIAATVRPATEVAATVHAPTQAAPAASAQPVAPAMAPAASHPSPDINWAKVQVGPSLPMTVFTSTQRWHAERIGALAIYCSDGRWGNAFDEFCHRSLDIPHYDRFAVPGGPAWINQISTDSPDLYRAAHGQLEYLVRSHELDRIVLITHYACGFYHERHHLEPDACIPLQTDDVKKAAQTLRQWFKDVKIEGYLAMRNDNVLSFHQLEV